MYFSKDAKIYLIDISPYSVKTCDREIGINAFLLLTQKPIMATIKL